ncbi:MAG: hypothetical protein GY756_02745 [bacterium]|nr:hypothetical protein [bacterium]
MDNKQRSQKYYYGYGLNISSDIHLPLPVSSIDNNFDVNISFGKIPEDIECERKISSYSISQDCFIMNLKSIKIFVGYGKEIVIECVKNKKIIQEDIVTFLLSSCIGALLHQRRIPVLHASSILTKKGAVIFIGNASCGKSTLAAAFKREKNYAVLSDDICPIAITEGKAVMYPSGETLQIWKDVINSINIQDKSLKRIRPEINKFYYNDQNCHHLNSPVKISEIYLLNPSNKGVYKIENQFSVQQKFNILKTNIYRNNFAKEMFIENRYYKPLKQLAGQIPVKKFTKSNNKFNTEKLTDILEKDFLI